MFFSKISKIFNDQPKPKLDKIFDEYFPPKIGNNSESDNSLFSKDKNGNRTDIIHYDENKNKLITDDKGNKLKGKFIWKRLSEIPAFNNFSLFPNDEIHSCYLIKE